MIYSIMSPLKKAPACRGRLVATDKCATLTLCRAFLCRNIILWGLSTQPQIVFLMVAIILLLKPQYFSQTMAEQGATILDIGGESTRPGAEPVGFDEECQDGSLPVINALKAAGILSALIHGTPML